MGDAELMTKAILLRKKLGVDDSSPLDVFSLVQNLSGLSLVWYPMGEHLSGMCLKGANKTCIIAVNSSMSLGRQRFSLAHELFHRFYDTNMRAICAQSISQETGKEIEKQADRFASFLLMPPAALDLMTESLASRNQDDKLVIEDIIRIGQYFGVSHKAAMVRLKGSPFMSRSKFELFFNEFAVKDIARAMGYRMDLYCPLPENMRYGTYGHYICQAEQLLKHGRISDGKYEELLLSAFRPDLVYGNEEGGYVID